MAPQPIGECTIQVIREKVRLHWVVTERLIKELGIEEAIKTGKEVDIALRYLVDPPGFQFASDPEPNEIRAVVRLNTQGNYEAVFLVPINQYEKAIDEIVAYHGNAN